MEKPLPQSIEAECGVLGSMIIDPEAVAQVADFLTPDDFYRDAHRTIYEVVLALYRQGEPADFITICDELERRNRLEAVGGASYITSLINQVPTSGNVEYYGRIVERTSILRQLIHAAGQIAAIAYEEADAEVALSKVQSLIFQIAARRHQSRLAEHRSALAEYFELLGQLYDRRRAGLVVTGVESGFTRLDRMTGGLQKGDFAVFAARPSVGKSSLALNIALHAIKGGSTVIFFSLEMPREQLCQRLLADVTGIDQARLRIGFIDDRPIQVGERIFEGEWDLITDSYAQLHDTPGTLWIDDASGLSALDIRNSAHKVLAHSPVHLLIVDYLQLMQAQGMKRGVNPVQEVSQICKDLKQIAREFDVPLLALAQLSRAAEGIEPQLHHLKQSGSIEEDADLVGLMWLTEEARLIKDAEVGTDSPPPQYPVEFAIKKQRKGPTGQVPLLFTPWVTRFEERG